MVGVELAGLVNVAELLDQHSPLLRWFCLLTLAVIIERRPCKWRSSRPGSNAFNAIAFEMQTQMNAVAAQRIESVGLTIGIAEFAVITRLLVVIEDHLLVELFVGGT